jgi:tRNA acetyltransferase TAN1
MPGWPTFLVIFISCKAPVDPVGLVLKHIENVEKTGITHTRCGNQSIQHFSPLFLVIFVHLIETKPWLSRYAHRLTPVSSTCTANVPEIKSLAQRILKPFLAQNSATDCLVCPPIFVF